MSREQKMSALAKANTVRHERSLVRRELHERKLSFPTALEEPCVQTTKVEMLLLELPGVGKVKVGKWFKALGISHLATVEQLSDSRRRQLEELVG